MIVASTYRDGYDFYVSLTLNGEPVDVAGPFDDSADAELAAQRMAPPVLSLDELIDRTDREHWDSWSRSPVQRRELRQARRAA